MIEISRVMIYNIITKVSMSEELADPKKMWMQFLNADSEEDLIMLERTGIPEIKQGVNIIKDLSADAILRERVRAREDAERDYYSAISAATRQGIAIGEKNGINKTISILRSMGIDESILQQVSANAEAQSQSSDT